MFFISDTCWENSFLPFAFLLLSILLIAFRKIKESKKAKQNSLQLPPGPKGIPILGNLLMLGKQPHKHLHSLSTQYGPIMYLRLGFVPAIVVSSPQAAELILKTHDLVFASRPYTEAAKRLSYDGKGLTFSEYGSYWRNLRKLCTLELLSSLKIESFRSMREQELGAFVLSLKESAAKTVDLSAKVSALSTNMACLMVLGKKYIENDVEQKGFHAFVQEGRQLAAVPNVADYIPYIGVLDLQGLAKRMKAVHKFFDNFFEKIIDEHIMNPRYKGQHRDFIDAMLAFMQSEDLEIQIDRSNIKAVALDMLVGSMDTTATAIEWTISELLKHQRVMRKVQQELEHIVGMERMVEESDLVNFEYLDMVIKESLRLHPVAPLLIPHESMEDCTVNGFHIPKRSRIIVNTWSIGRDHSVWPDAEKFLPERFAGSNIDVRGRDFQLLPFGSGRRGCPGLHLGIIIIKLVVAQLIHCFDWKLPNGMLPSELNMDEEFGLAMPRAKHLSVIPKYRLHN